MIIDGLKRLFASDAFVPTSAIFPSIDDGHIARDLRLVEKARERGARNLPGPEETSLDVGEMTVVAAVEELRRKGLQNYDVNRDVYAKRLSRASTASLEVRSVANQARGDFENETKDFRGRMTADFRDLKEWNRALDDFRSQHRLRRPAYDDPALVKTMAILLGAILLETVLNGYLFAQRNELGLVGGALVSLLVSLVNVGGSSLLGWFARFLRHRNLILKLGGLLALLVWIGFLGVLNLGVAHFRDAVETLSGWSEAAERSLDSLLQTPWELNSIESWLLMGVGVLVGISAFLKLYMAGEPYPEYGRISRRFERALDDYASHLTDALASLQERRDDTVEALRDANDVVRDNVGEAIDALYGHRMMRSQLRAFLDQCDVKVQALHKVYRDENRAARTAPAPSHFDEAFRFPSFDDAEIDMGHREDAQRELREIGRIVDEAITHIHEDYRRLKEEYPGPADIIGVGMASSAPPSVAAQSLEPNRPVAPERLEVIEGSRRV